MVEAAMQSSAYCGLGINQLAGLRRVICTALPICTTATAVLMMLCTAATHLTATIAVALCCPHLMQVMHIVLSVVCSGTHLVLSVMLVQWNGALVLQELQK